MCLLNRKNIFVLAFIQYCCIQLNEILVVLSFLVIKVIYHWRKMRTELESYLRVVDVRNIGCIRDVCDYSQCQNKNIVLVPYNIKRWHCVTTLTVTTITMLFRPVNTIVTHRHNNCTVKDCTLSSRLYWQHANRTGWSRRSWIVINLKHVSHAKGLLNKGCSDNVLPVVHYIIHTSYSCKSYNRRYWSYHYLNCYRRCHNCCHRYPQQRYC